MALCSSAHNPLTQFSKHVQDDRGLHRDTFTSGGRRERQVFRSASLGKHEQAGFDFNQFSSTHSAPLVFTPPTQLLQPLYQNLSYGGFESSQAVGWLSEFQNRSFGAETTARKQNQHQSDAFSHQAIIGPGHAPARQQDMRSGYAHSANGFMLSRPAFSAVPQLYPMSDLGCKQSDLAATQSIIEDNLEKLDWDNIFASLETRTKTDVELSEDLVHHNDVVAAQAERTFENTMVDNILPLQIHNIDYRFQDENPYSETANPFEEGMRIIENDGNLSVAALAFEAACEANPTHFEAWKMLGSVLSQVEREETALEALNEALKLDPNNLDVMMRLAISYTNEGASSSAYDQLEQWITAKYPQILIPLLEPSNYLPTSSELLDRIKEPFLQAARLSVTSATDLDPDVQVGLGVLLFSAKEFQLAADCFSAAIQSTIPGALNTESQLHLLWNRYGACLGNMDRYNEAIEAYEMALAIRPNFVRARYNLGLLYYNKSEPLTAAKTVLEALVASNTADSNDRAAILKIVKVGTSHGRLEEIIHRGEPSSMYDTLRKCCGSLLEWDLIERVGPSMDLQSFQQELDKL